MATTMATITIVVTRAGCIELRSSEEEKSQEVSEEGEKGR
jgi:hypothetical protein